MEVKKIEDGNNMVLQVTRKIFYQVAKNEEEEVKMAMVDYAKKNNAELRLLDEDEVKVIIDLGCKEYLKGHNSGYISKDKIRDIIKCLEHEPYTAFDAYGELLYDTEIDIKQKLEKLLEE